MIPNPIRKVLSTIQKNQVQALLMGGQACVLYGGAEFSRDTDLAIPARSENLDALRRALAELEAECLAVPPFEIDYLRRGHAVRFRCGNPDVKSLRIDLMAVMRGVDPFPELWDRRTTIETHEGHRYEILSLPDLVCAKKTQRDKDWLMVRRLLDAHYSQNHRSPTREQIRFWFREMRTPKTLLRLTSGFAELCAREAGQRPLLEHAIAQNLAALREALVDEENHERKSDQEYWEPLRQELRILRHHKREKNRA